MEIGISVNIIVVNALRWLESHVVIAWVVVLSERPHLGEEQWASVLTQCLNGNCYWIGISRDILVGEVEILAS